MAEGMERPRKSLRQALGEAYDSFRTAGGSLDDIPPGEVLTRTTQSVARNAERASKAAGPAVLAATVAVSAPSAAHAQDKNYRFEEQLPEKQRTERLALDALMADIARHESPDEAQQDVLSKADIACLARNAFNEARGEGFEGQLGTILVTLARVKSRRFANSVCGVVYQPYQFSWTHDERILLAQAQNERRIDPIFAKLDTLLGGQHIDEAIALLASLLKLPPETLYYKRTDWDENNEADALKKGMSKRAIAMWRSLRAVGVIGSHTFYTDPPGKDRSRR